MDCSPAFFRFSPEAEITNNLSRISSASQVPTVQGTGETPGVGIAYYSTDHELLFYLRALQRFQAGRLVVVLGLQPWKQLYPADLPTRVRIILTAQGNEIDPNEVVGWYVTDPLQAVVLAMTGLLPNDGLILLFPADWRGDSPESLIEQARNRLVTASSSRTETGNE